LVTLPGSSSFDIFGFLNEFIVTAVRDDDASEAIARAFAFVSLSSRTRGVTRARGCDDGSGASRFGQSETMMMMTRRAHPSGETSSRRQRNETVCMERVDAAPERDWRGEEYRFELN